MTRLLRTCLASAAVWLAAMPFTAQAVEYRQLQVPASSVTFRYQQMGVAMDGRFKKFNAQVSFDPAQLAKAQGRIDIDLASIDTGSPEADQEVVGKPWFHVAAYPKATFVLKSLQAIGPGKYEALGSLSIKGQTRELRAPLTLTPQGQLSGSFLLRRGDFGIGEGMWAKFDVVANEITVNFKLQLQ
jgi:polyisoprenoid-binding protein YceI